MGREGGSYILVFDNKKDAQKFIDTERIRNIKLYYYLVTRSSIFNFLWK